MGKGNLLLGTGRGKLGDAVFYRTGGEQRFRVRVKGTNPKTYAQTLQRVVVATAVKAYSPLISVCDHAFQNFSGKAKNQERFMRLNIMLLRKMALQNVKSWSPLRFNNEIVGNWIGKDEILVAQNPYIISEGDLPEVPVNFINSGGGNRPVFVSLPNTESITYRNVIEALGLQQGDQLTFVFQRALTNGIIVNTSIARIILNPANGDLDTPFQIQKDGSNIYVINEPNAENYGELNISSFETGETTKTKHFFVYPSRWNAGWVNTEAVIVSRWENGMWRRSNAQMTLENPNIYFRTLEDAMNTYYRDETSSLYLNQAQQATEDIYTRASTQAEEEAEEEGKKKVKKS